MHLRDRLPAQAGITVVHELIMWYVYFLARLVKSNWVYVGSTNNIDRRLNEHNLGQTKSTKVYRPYKIIYMETFDNEQNARTREDYFKHWRGRLEKKQIVTNCGIV